MKILVTGGAGFIGSHLIPKLLQRGDSIIAVDNLSTGRRDNLAHVDGHGSFRFELADADNPAGQLNALVGECEGVIHLAAAVGVQKIIDEPVATLETNVDYAQFVLKACSAKRVRTLIASTSEVYGRSENEWFRETDDLLIGTPTHSRWGYAASKLLDEFLALAYYHEKQLPVTIMRLFNTVGPRQTGRYGMVIPRLVSRALRGEPLEIYGDGQQRRTFTDVDQSTDAIIALFDCRDAIGEIVNIGGTAEVSINELADAILRLTGSKSEKRLVPYEEAYGQAFEDMRRRNPDLDKLRRLIGWAPDRGLDAILLPVIEDLRAHPDRA